MATAHDSKNDLVIRAKTGRFVIVHGVGALKGQLTIDKDVDLTKPIAVQAGQRRSAAKPKPVAGKQ